MTRRETTFGQLLRELTAVCREENARVNGEGDLSGVSDELLLKAVAGSVVNYANTIARYDSGMLDEVFSDAVSMARVFYLAFDVTVPAGGSVSVTAAMRKEPSMDLYHGGDSENWRDYGYDLVTRLGSNLTFTAQRALPSGTRPRVRLCWAPCGCFRQRRASPAVSSISPTHCGPSPGTEASFT